MQYQFETEIIRRNKRQKVKIIFSVKEHKKSQSIKNIKVYENGKEIRNYSYSFVINAILNYLEK